MDERNMQAIERIISRGNSAIVKKSREGIIVLEVQKVKMREVK